MDLKNKTVVFLGDSITEGVGASSPETNYVARFAKAHPEAKVYNLGISGSRLALQIKPSLNPRWDKYFASRICEMPKSVDLICVFGGTNDYGHGDAPFGNLGDTDGNTFSGAAYDLYNRLVNKYPDAKIVVFTPTHRDNEADPHEKPDGIFVLADYVERIRQTAEYFSIPILDLWRISGIQPEIPILREKFMPDGIHPSDAGYARLFEIINSYITAI